MCFLAIYRHLYRITKQNKRQQHIRTNQLQKWQVSYPCWMAFNFPLQIMFIIFFFAVDEIVSACSVTCNVYKNWNETKQKKNHNSRFQASNMKFNNSTKFINWKCLQREMSVSILQNEMEFSKFIKINTLQLECYRMIHVPYLYRGAKSIPCNISKSQPKWKRNQTNCNTRISK